MRNPFLFSRVLNLWRAVRSVPGAIATGSILADSPRLERCDTVATAPGTDLISPERSTNKGIIMRKLKLYSLVILLALSCALPTTFAQRKAGKTPAATTAAAARTIAARGVDTISAAQLRNYLSFIASDEMEGRDTPSPGLDTTAKFIAINLERWGFKPAGDDGTFFQKIALRP